MRLQGSMSGVVIIAVLAMASPLAAQAQTQDDKAGSVLTGKAAFGDWHSERPGVRRHIKPGDLPPANLRGSTQGPVQEVARRDQKPNVPDGFEVNLFASGLDQPRIIRVAPNGDVFVAETDAGRVKVLRPGDNGAAAQQEVFAQGLRGPFGIAFYPAADPQWVYVANTDCVVRFPYRAGDLRARGKPETIVDEAAVGRRAFDPRHRLLARRHAHVRLGGLRVQCRRGHGQSSLARRCDDWEADHAARRRLGRGGASVPTFSSSIPKARTARIFATGIRNCVGLAIQPDTGDLWCSINERDELGDDVPPTTPRASGKTRSTAGPGTTSAPTRIRASRASGPTSPDKVTVPDVLLQAAFGPAQHRLLRAARSFPAGVPRRRLRRAARLVEPRQAHRLQGRAHHPQGRRTDRRIRGFRHRLRHR